MSGENWKLEKDLCRCCHAEGSFVNLGMPCEDHAETYSDMLKNCLDINVIPVEGGLCELTYTICESCILRLRDASNFKRQVLMLEERFKEMYSKNFIKTYHDVKVELPDPYPDAFKEEEDYSSHMDEDGFDFIQFADVGKNGVDVKGVVKIEKKGKGKAKPKPKPIPKKKVTKKKVARRPKQEAEGSDAADEPEEEKKTGNKKANIGRNDENETATADEQTCPKCNMKYKYLRRHINCKYKPTKCPECPEIVINAKMKLHRHQKHGLPIPSCGVCDFKSVNRANVLRHQRKVHMNEKTIKCDECDLKFFNTCNLKKHKVKHNPVKVFECPHCNKKFARKITLTTHVKIHTGDKKKVCPVCGEKFVQKASLNYHMARHHPGKPF